MQKWCPESLVSTPASSGAFEPLAPATASLDADASGFRSEAGFNDPQNLLRQLSREERTQIMELLEQDLRREYDDRYRQETAARNDAESERIRTLTEQHERWQRELTVGVRREVRDALSTLARHTAAIAAIMATKLVRREVEHDPEILVRALETVLYKTAAGCPLSVTVHPDDASWLESAPAVRERLRIREIKEDRRLEPGGCLVKTDELEWDATVERQLAVLTDALDEALAVPPAQPDDPAPAPEATDA